MIGLETLDGPMESKYDTSGIVETESSPETESFKSVSNVNVTSEPYIGLSPGRRRLRSIAAKWKFMSLRSQFHLLGESTGAHPCLYIAVSLLLACSSFGIFKIKLKDLIREGYTPVDAPSRYEMDVMREFWNATGDPMVVLVMLRARDGGSMLRDEYLAEAVRLEKFLAQNFTIECDGKTTDYSKLCDPYCESNIALSMFKDAMDAEVKNLEDGLSLSNTTTLSYPVVEIHGFEMHIEVHFYGVTLKKMYDKNAFLDQKLTKDKLPPNTSYSQLITNMDHVKVILMTFRGDKPNEELDRTLKTWELSLLDYSRNKYNDTLVDMQVIGTEIMEHAVTEDGMRLAPYFAVGFGCMIIFVATTVVITAMFHDALDWGKALIAAGVILCPVLSITTTYGLVSIFGIRTNSFMLIMPFLVMGIGVDDGFLMIHSWQRLGACSSKANVRIGLVLEEVGPSMSITSLTNFISFGIGAFTPTPEIRLFCMTIAIAIGLDYLYELILFGPILAVATRFEKNIIQDRGSRILSGWRLKIDRFLKGILKLYCRIIGHRCFTIGIFGVVGIYLYFAIIGASTIKPHLDTMKFLPRESPAHMPNVIMNEIIWAEYHPMTVLVNKEVDIAKKDQHDRLMQLVKEFESLAHCRANSTLLWLRDYEQYRTPTDIFYQFLPFFAPFEAETTTAVAIRDETSTGLSYDKLEGFLDSVMYSHWKTSVQVEKTSSGPRVRRFSFTVVYQNMSLWADRINLMKRCRKIAQSYKDLNVTVWEANGMFIDQMLSLKSVAIQNTLLTLICMAVVCALFIPNPSSIITASLAIASITVGVFGFLSWWHLDLDPVTMAAVLMSIGLSVDFVAHVAYHYQLVKRKEIVRGKIVKIPVAGPQEKLLHTLETVGLPMIQAGASTVVCVVPLVFQQSYPTTVFFKTIVLVVSWGLLHGLIVLPALLGALPDKITNANCYRTFLSTSSKKSCRYIGPYDPEAQEYRSANGRGDTL